MKPRVSINYWLSVVLGILALLLAVSALLLWVVFPKGYFPGRIFWVEVHKWVGLSITIGVIFHVVLHWKWLVQMTRRYIIWPRNRNNKTIDSTK